MSCRCRHRSSDLGGADRTGGSFDKLGFNVIDLGLDNPMHGIFRISTPAYSPSPPRPPLPVPLDVKRKDHRWGIPDVQVSGRLEGEKETQAPGRKEQNPDP